ncbi:unnamed protein product [Penicillium crustosum]
MNGTEPSYEQIQVTTEGEISRRPSVSENEGPPSANPPSEAGSDGENNAHKPSDTSQSPSNRLNDWFVWEILGLAISTGVLIALAAVLAQYNRNPQPSWRYMSLNSLISWLSTIFRAGIVISSSEALGQLKWIWFAQKRERPVQELGVYDSATRGPYGAIKLIWTLRARHFAVLGSIAVILAIAIDPFAQNLVYYYQDMVDDPFQQALLARTDNYTGSSNSSTNMLAGSGVDVVLKANVYSSLLNNDPQRPWATSQYSCPSGNCTWDPVAALEARALCADVTSLLSGSCIEPEDNFGITNCTLSLPGNQTQASYIGPDDGKSFRTGQEKDMIFVSNGVDTPVAESNRVNTTLGVVQFIARQKDLPPDRLLKTMSSTDGFEATECAIVPVVRSFRPSVENNVYKEETLATWGQSSLIRGDRLVAHYDLVPPWGPEMGTDQPNQVFGYDVMSSRVITKFVQDILTGHLSNSYGALYYLSTVPDPIYAGRDILVALGEGEVVGCGDYLPSRLNCTMENIAQAVSKSFRDSRYRLNAEDESGRAVGRVRISVTHVGVRWAWIVLPVLVLLLGILVLVGTLWKARQRCIPKWKNDLLPLLFLYSDMTDEKAGGFGLPAQGSLSHTKQMKVRLDTSDGRILLR